MKHYRDENWEKILLPKGNIEINLSTGEENKVEPIEKHYSCELKDFDEKERTFTAIASTEAKDRDGDILRANGWKLKNYKKNPVVLLFHNSQDFPIAKSVKTFTDDGKLYFTPKFATADMNPMAEYAWQMYKNNFMRAFSVRFDPIKWIDIEQDEDENQDSMFFRKPREYKSQELLEISMVNIPSNPEALKSPLMHDFVVKSFIAGNSKRFPGIDISKLFKGDEEKAKYKCECIECGHKIESDKHCKDLKCSKCGGQMRRAERPGPGQPGQNDYDFSEDLKDKYEKVEELKRQREKRIIESALDQEIKTLEEALENDNAVEILTDNINSIQETIGKLAKK